MSVALEALLAGLHAAVAPPGVLLLPFFVACGAAARSDATPRLQWLVALLAALAFFALGLRGDALGMLRQLSRAAIGSSCAILALAALAFWRPRLWLAGPLALALGALWLPVGLGPTQSALRGAWPQASGGPAWTVIGVTVSALACYAIGRWLLARRVGLAVLGLYAGAALAGWLGAAMRWFWLRWPLPLGG